MCKKNVFMKRLLIWFEILWIAIIFCCNDNTTNIQNPIIYPSPYSIPSWDPSGNYVIFNWTKYNLASKNLDHQVISSSDSFGFWMIDTNTLTKRKVMPYELQSYDINSNYDWIVYSKLGENKLLKARFFTGIGIDTTTVTVLEDSNSISPSFSQDGLLILYNKLDTIICTQNIWKMSSDGSGKRCIQNGLYPDFSFDGTKMIFIKFTNSLNELYISDTLDKI